MIDQFSVCTANEPMDILPVVPIFKEAKLANVAFIANAPSDVESSFLNLRMYQFELSCICY